MENNATKKNNTFRNCRKFSQGARGVFHMEAPGSVQEPGDDFFIDGLVQEPEDEFVIEGQGLVQE